MAYLACYTLVLLLTLGGACAQDYKEHTMCKTWWRLFTSCTQSDVSYRRQSGIGKDCGNDVKYRVVQPDDQKIIVDLQNELRSKVALGEETNGLPGPQPPAANMRKLEWDDELAEIAQRWAEQCISKHDKCREVERFKVGQNVYYSSSSVESSKQDWPTTINSWYSEVQNFSNGDLYPYHFTSGIGHYTQLAWANSKYVGCGYTGYNLDGWFKTSYVCNFGSAGNTDRDQMYIQGKACSACSDGCSDPTSGLCN